MQNISWKTGFFAFSFFAIASLTGGVLTACSTNASQNQTEATNTTATEASNKQHMNHGGMNHGGMNHSMDLGRSNANYDLRFIDAMTIHHQGATEMAQEAQQKSKRPQIKQLAADIIKAQNLEIRQMKQWRQSWYANAGNQPMAYDSASGKLKQMSSEQMQAMKMSMNLGAADAEFDLRFLNGMIPHHEGAVVMAQDALKKSKRPEVKKLAQEIITSQQKEIDQMKQWRKAWYNK
ncbi:DUF305 domain-containing protein [Iningainema tapete]|uniref:DUF305 domain-containing protein n=1 Tax=Iningainema tapete BLCC-T55 TaxID=2748662 RepID=A0A8J7CE96_9CYAN|nr:DUF305 domain-containing protein [Iningainema tapete]MBD2773355.1 DUF305 domain-containing protein [Iningainema tapete BLCC-T55]